MDLQPKKHEKFTTRRVFIFLNVLSHQNLTQSVINIQWWKNAFCSWRLNSKFISTTDKRSRNGTRLNSQKLWLKWRHITHELPSFFSCALHGGCVINTVKKRGFNGTSCDCNHFTLNFYVPSVFILHMRVLLYLSIAILYWTRDEYNFYMGGGGGVKTKCSEF